ncbi:DUF5711 family protein [Novisyntrophococcus fermenticellae]|uniref:DUF5711 family protein n=1 Tax=Novisyntrophococcus fermenticellae TaxID=2068655 RepID=UPI001E32449A|nr:DUF5711 family protein [Novisyntrophococcus fermenticellae]
MDENKEIDFEKLQKALEEVPEVHKEESKKAQEEVPEELQREALEKAAEELQREMPEEAAKKLPEEEPGEKKNAENKELDHEGWGEQESEENTIENTVLNALSAATIFVHNEKKRRKSSFETKSEPSFSGRTKAVISSLSEYKERLWACRKKKWFRAAAVAIAVLVFLLSVTQVEKYWTYDSYTMETTLTEEDTTTATYSRIGDKVLKYGLDGASLSDSNGKELWNSSYTMNAPAVNNCDGTFVIYDTQGTSMNVYQESGKIGSVSTDMPIVKAKVAKQGVVAAILESGENTWIQYYDKEGSSIASFKTTLDSPGYPLDLTLSEDGLLMSVSYLQMKQGIPETQIAFYNWSSIGQNQMDNMVNSYTLKNTIAPQVEYLSRTECLAFRDDGFTVYEGQQIPKQEAEVNEKKEIISAFYNSSHVGYVVHNDDSGKAFTMKVYNLKGKEIFTKDFDFEYDSISMGDNQVLMYNNKQMCTYSLSGVKKFEGDIKKGILNNVLPFSSNRYMLVTDSGTCFIKLR